MSHIGVLFQYIHKESVIHKLDPRVKFAWFTTMLFTIILIRDTIILAVIYTFILLMFYISRLPKDAFFALNKWLFRVMIPFYLAFGVVFYGAPEGSTVLFYIIPPIKAVPITIEGLNFVTSASLKILIIALSIGLTSAVTPIPHIVRALVKCKVPPLFAMISSMCLSTAPIILDEARIIDEAQRARAFNLGALSLKEKITKAISVKVVPLILCSMERSMKTAVTLECKGFGQGLDKRTYLEEIRLRRNDYIFMALLTLYILALVYLTYYCNINEFTVHLMKKLIL